MEENVKTVVDKQSNDLFQSLVESFKEKGIEEGSLDAITVVAAKKNVPFTLIGARAVAVKMSDGTLLPRIIFQASAGFGVGSKWFASVDSEVNLGADLKSACEYLIYHKEIGTQFVITKIDTVERNGVEVKEYKIELYEE